MFIQVIEFSTDRPDEVQALIDEYLAASEGTRTSQRGILSKSRDAENRYVNIVFFESYEAAMRNSELPATGHFSEQMMKLCSGPPTFQNLDVLFESDH
ncbi:MAG: hypothetical protein JWO22_2975 [Frankiales bacterium]|nr:hypothetical protein [Frankiales bacterium]